MARERGRPESMPVRTSGWTAVKLTTITAGDSIILSSMKNEFTVLDRRLHLAVALLVTLAVAGCEDLKRVVWSPDGPRAAILAEEGLFFCDASGKLTGPLASNVVFVAWFPDSQRIVFARNIDFRSWGELAPALTPTSRAAISRIGDALLEDLKAGRAWAEAGAAAKQRGGLNEDQLKAVLLYSRDRDPAAAAHAAGNDANKLSDLSASWRSLQIGRLTDSKLDSGPPLLAGLEPRLLDARVSPGATAILIATEDEHGANLSALPTEGTPTSRPIEQTAAAYADWSPDGRSIVYLRGVGPDAGNDQPRLAILTRRQILNESGQIELQAQGEDLANLLFNPLGKVRCLKDGRILFAAAEITLPSTSVDVSQRQQLFELEPGKRATLAPRIPRGTLGNLPEDLSHFEVSPDEKRVSFVSEKGAVTILSLGTGQVEVAQSAPGGEDDVKTIPVWRSAEELCFIAPPQPEHGEKKAEVVLWQNGKARALSHDWPASVRNGLLD